MAKKQDWIIGGIIFGAIFICTIFFIIFMLQIGGKSDMTLSGAGEKVAIIELEGVIYSSENMVRQFKKFGKDETVKAIVFRINSPGGGIAASQEIYEHVKRVRDNGKPIVVSMGSVAASGGYYVALGADTIMANPGTTTGSIGVIAEFPNFRKLLDKIGISITVIKSGNFKDAGSPYREIKPEEMAYFQSWIDNGYDQFVSTVVNERQLSRDTVLKLADGRVYSGEQALTYNLIDTLGTFDDAINLAAEMGGIKGEPKVIRDRLRKMTMFEMLTEDAEVLLSRHLSLWPQMKYMMTL